MASGWDALKLLHPGDSFGYCISRGSVTLVYANDVSYNNPTPHHMKNILRVFQGCGHPDFRCSLWAD